uniref:ATP synthase complex subunit 8 n=1 Tax=Pethia gelius TaxID=496989 RepID=A0A125SX60_9TELE|nr:ATPase subunit 8 [Pethia gelius]
MPQLNTNPWFTILFTAWFVFVTVVPAKIASYSQPENISATATHMWEMDPWQWLW